jgi:DNA-binding LacI/PurR family transcriptional regulator
MTTQYNVVLYGASGYTGKLTAWKLAERGIPFIAAGRNAEAQGALLTAARKGIDVPKRIAIAGFNDLTGSDQMIPPLTTVHTPRSEIGAEAAAMLLKLMRGEPVRTDSVDVGYSLAVRKSG